MPIIGRLNYEGIFREFLRSRLQVLKHTRLPRDGLVYTAATLVHLALGCGVVIRTIRSAMLLTRATWILPMREDFVRAKITM